MNFLIYLRFPFSSYKRALAKLFHDEIGDSWGKAIAAARETYIYVNCNHKWVDSECRKCGAVLSYDSTT